MILDSFSQGKYPSPRDINIFLQMNTVFFQHCMREQPPLRACRRCRASQERGRACRRVGCTPLIVPTSPSNDWNVDLISDFQGEPFRTWCRKEEVDPIRGGPARKSPPRVCGKLAVRQKASHAVPASPSKRPHESDPPPEGRDALLSRHPADVSPSKKEAEVDLETHGELVEDTV